MESKEWPSISLAYEFVRPSYELAERRLQAVENRIQNVLAFALTLALGTIAILGGIRAELKLCLPFWIAVSALSLTTLVGTLGRSWGSLSVYNLKHLYENTLHLAEWEFRKNVLAWADDDFAENVKLINRKGLAVTIMTWCSIVEAAALAWWFLSLV